MKSKISYHYNSMNQEFRMIKFIGEDKTITSDQVSDFINNVTNLCNMNYTNYVEDLLSLEYGKSHNIRSYIERKIPGYIKITDLTLCKSPVVGPVSFSHYRDESGDSGAVVCFTTTTPLEEYKSFIETLLRIIKCNKPLVIYKNDLLPTILEIQKGIGEKGYKHISIENDFLPNTVLELQKINNELIGDLLNKYKINIVDYTYI